MRRVLLAALLLSSGCVGAAFEELSGDARPVLSTLAARDRLLDIRGSSDGEPRFDLRARDGTFLARSITPAELSHLDAGLFRVYQQSLALGLSATRE